MLAEVIIENDQVFHQNPTYDMFSDRTKQRVDYFIQGTNEQGEAIANLGTLREAYEAVSHGVYVDTVGLGTGYLNTYINPVFKQFLRDLSKLES